MRMRTDKYVLWEILQVLLMFDNYFNHEQSVYISWSQFLFTGVKIDEKSHNVNKDKKFILSQKYHFAWLFKHTFKAIKLTMIMQCIQAWTLFQHISMQTWL